jgi:hypothetical protein
VSADIGCSRVARVVIDIEQHAHASPAVVKLCNSPIWDVQIRIGNKWGRLGQSKRRVIVCACRRERAGVGAQIERIPNACRIKISREILAGSRRRAHLRQQTQCARCGWSLVIAVVVPGQVHCARTARRQEHTRMTRAGTSWVPPGQLVGENIISHVDAGYVRGGDHECGS